jgi:hypothetical protein
MASLNFRILPQGSIGHGPPADMLPIWHGIRELQVSIQITERHRGSIMAILKEFEELVVTSRPGQAAGGRLHEMREASVRAWARMACTAWLRRVGRCRRIHAC